MRAFLILLLTCTAALAEGEKAGRFDYYVLSLSWTPTWCNLTGDARAAPECDSGTAKGWTLHGLWPQYHRGWPAYCATAQRPPSRAMTQSMSDIMGNPGLAWHQWKKHGQCSGLSASAYYALAREAYARVHLPEVFETLNQPVTLPASVVEAAFLKANPGWEADMLTITCRDGHIEEARLCLSHELDPVPCGQDVVRDCQLKNARLDPIRTIPEPSRRQ